MSSELAINSIRCFCADMVQKANSGHPGAPMGMAPMAHVLWTKVMDYSPANPLWYNRDRFVLSNGHGCALLYTLLHLTGYEQFTIEQVKNFRQVESITAGHPESLYDGIEVTTGPLGQGIANAVGLAIAQANLAATFNKEEFPIFSNFTYVFCGDGCLMEGVSAEAASLAGHLGLGRLIVLYDDNKISIDGSTELAFTENVIDRFNSYGWHTLTVEKGDSDVDAIYDAVQTAKSVTDKPTLIAVRTTIGFGSGKQATEKVHGSPLGDDDIVAVKKLFGFNPEEKFHIPDEVRALYTNQKTIGKEKEEKWNTLFAEYAKKYPEQAKEITRRFEKKLPEGWQDSLPTYKPGDSETATRKNSQDCLSALANKLPELIGGSADLAPSNLTLYDGVKDFQKGQEIGRNIRYGVREHGMAAISNGLFAYGGLIPYCATFLNFFSYCAGAVTLSALAHAQVIYIMTHDSIGLGEDGPTHQPIEKLLTARGLPNLLLFRPADGTETAGSYIYAIETPNKPSMLALSRQNLPQLQGSSRDGVKKGAYVLQDSEGTPDVILIASGSEVSLCVKAAAKIEGKKVRIVSIPSWELFDDQSKEYRLQVLPDGVPVLAVEAATTIGWERYSHACLGLKTHGISGKGDEVYKYFGITPENIATKAVDLINFYGDSRPRSPVNVLTF